MKRETGVNPVRTRHCNQGVCNQRVQRKITGEPGRWLHAMICKSGDLP